MKSAYELAMERLRAESGPDKALSDEQKARIADIEKKYQAKVAEAKLNYDNRYAKAATVEEAENARAELASELKTLEERRDREKEEVRNEA